MSGFNQLLLEVLFGVVLLQQVRTVGVQSTPPVQLCTISITPEPPVSGQVCDGDKLTIKCQTAQRRVVLYRNDVPVTFTRDVTPSEAVHQISAVSAAMNGTVFRCDIQCDDGLTQCDIFTLLVSVCDTPSVPAAPVTTVTPSFTPSISPTPTFIPSSTGVSHGSTSTYTSPTPTPSVNVTTMPTTEPSPGTGKKELAWIVILGLPVAVLAAIVIILYYWKKVKDTAEKAQAKQAGLPIQEKSGKEPDGITDTETPPPGQESTSRANHLRQDQQPHVQYSRDDKSAQTSGIIPVDQVYLPVVGQYGDAPQDDNAQGTK